MKNNQILSRTIVRLLFLVLVPLSYCARPGAIDMVEAVGIDPERGIYDHAGILSHDEANSLADVAAAMRKKHGMSFSILIERNAGGKRDMHFADDFFERYLLVSGQPNHGILLFINLEGRSMWLSTHGKAIRYFSDRTLDNMIGRIAVPLKRDSYHDGGQVFLREANRVCSDRQSRRASYAILGGLGLGAVVSGLLLLFHHSSRGRAPGARRYLAKGHSIAHKGTTFIRTFTTSTPRVKKKSGGFGGSSTHRSSGGRTFGGRGGRF